MCNDWHRLNTQALDALDHGEIALAEKAFLSACESQDFRAYNNLGRFYYVQGTDGAVKGSVTEALSQLQRAIAHTRHPIILQNIAAIRFEDRDYSEALELLQEARRSCNDNILLYNIGVCHFRTGNRTAASSCFREVDVANAAKLIQSSGARHPRLAYAYCVQGEERAAALHRYAPERRGDELLDYFMLCILCGEYRMAAAELSELLAQWQLTDQVLAMAAECILHVPSVKEQTLGLFTESDQKRRLLRFLKEPKQYAALLTDEAFTPVLAMHEGYFE